MSAAEAPPSRGSTIKTTVQKVGANLAGMVMPNIGAFLAWGLITALFIPTGWWPNERMATLVGPMILSLLPILIGYTGGRLVHGQRGAVVGAVATVGVIVGADIPMFLGAMMIGPLAAYILKKVDALTESRIKPGFEMLIENFTAGIVGGITAAAGLWAIGPVVRALTDAAGTGVQFLVDNRLLPFAHVIIEPAKVLFLNNAINHGVLSPLGVAEATDSGRSILFLLEPNPGVGLGILVAFLMFGPRALRASTPGAMIIHFLGGIHEIYFPYILMKPRLILAAMAGGASGTLVFLITGAGLVATPSPGSIFTLLALTPKGGWLGVLAGVLVAAGVTWAVAGVLMKFGRGEKLTEEDAAALYGDATVLSAANKPATPAPKE